MTVAVGSLVLTLACLSLGVLALTGFIRYRTAWGRFISLFLCVSYGVYCVAIEHLVRETGSGSSLFWARLVLGLGTPIVLASHLFSLILGRADPAGSLRERRAAVLTQGLLGIGFLVLLFHPDFVREYAYNEGAFSVRLGMLGRFYLGYLLLGVGMAALRIEGTFRASRGPTRENLQWGVIGLFGAAGYFTYLLTEGAINAAIDRDALVASSVPIFFSSLLIALSHFRGGMAAAGVVVERQVIYKSATGVVAALYISAVLAMGYLTQFLGLRFGHLTAITFIFLAGLGLFVFLFSRGLRRRLLRWIDRSFYSARPDYRTYWLRASHELVSGVGVADLKERATNLIEDLLDARPVTIHLSRRSGDPYQLMSTTGGAEPPDVDINEPVIIRLAKSAEPLVIQPVSARRGKDADPGLLPIYVENEVLLETTRACVIAPLRTAERLIGFVSVGPRGTGGRYTFNDLALLETVTLQLAGAIRSAWLSEDLGTAREMEVFSQWANVVVHDLKNYVSPLKLFLQNARRHLHNPRFREQAIDDIQSVVEKMDRQIQHLTAIRRGDELSPTSTDLHWVLDGVASRCGLENHGTVRLDKKYGRVPALTGDPTLLDRVFTNLVTNAIEAMPDGGVLTVETEDVRDEANGNRWAVVRIRDTGIGMSKAFLQHRLFQPFATTKKKGWGLGLYQCRTIVEAHGGLLTALSQPGLGTEFKVALPLSHLARSHQPLVGPGSVTGRRPPA